MNNPPHPGGGIRYDIKAMGWTVAECAKRLGLSRTTLSRVLNGKQAITPATALSLERLGWSDADTWMRLQAIYDLAQERRGQQLELAPECRDGRCLRSASSCPYVEQICTKSNGRLGFLSNAVSGCRLPMGLPRIAQRVRDAVLAWMGGLWQRRTVPSSSVRKNDAVHAGQTLTGTSLQNKSSAADDAVQPVDDCPSTSTVEPGALPSPNDLDLATLTTSTASDSAKADDRGGSRNLQTSSLDEAPKLTVPDQPDHDVRLPENTKPGVRSDPHDGKPLPVGGALAAEPPQPVSHEVQPETQVLARETKHGRNSRAPTGKAPRRAKERPNNVGGQRGKGKSPSAGSEPDTSATRVPRPELMCRKNGVQWEVFLSATDECQITNVHHGEASLDPKDGEYDLPSLAGCLSVTLRNGQQDLQLPLAEDERPLIFKLRTNWEGPGRRIGHLTHGHFIVIAPHNWDREGHVPVEPEDCTDTGFRAHYFHRTQDESGSMAFKQCRIPLTRTSVSLRGHIVFDDSDEGPLYGGNSPPTLADVPGVVWARVGQEGDGGWRGKNFQPAKQTLANVLNGRQGRFFVRVYDEQMSMLDSEEFRYFPGLKAIEINNEPYTDQSVLAPGPAGHRLTKIRLAGADAGILVRRPTEYARAGGDCVVVDPVAEADVVSCASEASQADVELHLPRIWWRVDSMVGSTDDGPWCDKPPKLTRQQFVYCADRGAALHVRLPRRFKRARVGFEDEQGRLYSTETRENGYSSLTVRLEDFCLHRQIDQRLNDDAFLCVEIDKAKLRLVRVLRDPMPKVVQFSCHPTTIALGERATLCWNTLDAEAEGVVIEPGVGAVPPNGTCEIAPSVASSYTLKLTASGADDVTATVDVTVQSVRCQRNQSSRATPLVALVRRRHGGLRPGRGFSYGELGAVSIAVVDAKRRSIPLDKRRRTTHARNTVILGGLPDA